MMQKLYFLLRNLHLLLSALVLPIATITIGAFNENLGMLQFWYALLGGYFFFMIWAMFYLILELSYYPENLRGALRYTGGFILSLVLFFAFLKTGWQYTVYVSFYNSFVALILFLIGLYIAYLIKGKTLPIPRWGHAIVVALIALSLVYTYRTGLSFFNKVIQTTGVGKWILITSFLGQAVNTALHWSGLGPSPSKEQEKLNETHANVMVVVTILSVFAAMVIASGTFNEFLNRYLNR